MTGYIVVQYLSPQQNLSLYPYLRQVYRVQSVSPFLENIRLYYMLKENVYLNWILVMKKLDSILCKEVLLRKELHIS